MTKALFLPCARMIDKTVKRIVLKKFFIYICVILFIFTLKMKSQKDV